MMMLSQPFHGDRVRLNLRLQCADRPARSAMSVAAPTGRRDLGRRKVVKTTARLRPQAGKTLFPIKLNNGRLQVKQNCLVAADRPVTDGGPFSCAQSPAAAILSPVSGTILVAEEKSVMKITDRVTEIQSTISKSAGMPATPRVLP